MQLEAGAKDASAAGRARCHGDTAAKRGKKEPTLGWTGSHWSHRSHGSQEAGALIPQAGPDTGSSLCQCLGPGLSRWVRMEKGVLSSACALNRNVETGGFVWLPSTKLAPWDAPSWSSSFFPGPRHQAGTGQLIHEQAGNKRWMAALTWAGQS